jgi:GT2 family glycosyltransferase
MPHDYSITFACYNQVDYTKLCLDSLLKSGVPGDRIVIVDNASHDGTHDFLNSLDSNIHVIHNKSNLGCGTAWNQGVLALQTEWSIIMNNDVIVQNNFAHKLLNSSEENNLLVSSPAMIEGELNYSPNEKFDSLSQGMSSYYRPSSQHLVCLAVHQKVWSSVGFFQPVPRLIGYEDTLFFNELRKNDIKTGICGGSWIHHYGSITQSAMKKERNLKNSDSLGRRDNYKLLNKSFISRKWDKLSNQFQQSKFKKMELKTFGHSIHGTNFNDESIQWL